MMMVSERRNRKRFSSNLPVLGFIVSRVVRGNRLTTVIYDGYAEFQLLSESLSCLSYLRKCL